MTQVSTTTASPSVPIPADRVPDWIAIHQLVASYVHAMDNRELDLLMTLWHPTATWEFIGTAHGKHSGLDEIRAFAADTAWPARAATHHLVTSVVINLDAADTASGRSVCYAITIEHDGSTAHPIVARYEDEYVRHEGRWVFQSRRITSDWRAVQGTS
jgi:hypothetical protein